MSWGKGVGLLDVPDEFDEWQLSITDPAQWHALGLLESLRSELIQLVMSKSKRDENVASITRRLRKDEDSKSTILERKFEILLGRLKIGMGKLGGNLSWVAIERDKVEPCLQKLTSTIDSLVGLTSEKVQGEIMRMVNITYQELVMIHDTVDKLHLLVAALTGAEWPANKSLALLKMAIKKREDTASYVSTQPLLSGSYEMGVPIDKDDRQVALYRGAKGFWVEWKDYRAPDSPDSGPNKADVEKFIVRELVGLLAEEQLHIIRVPQCIGYFDHYPQRTRFGLLYKYPEGINPNAQLLTLSSLLESKEGNTCGPDLAVRIELARAIAQTLHYLHAVGWLHKALRPDNILFFKKPGMEVEYNSPYLSGFDEARPARHTHMTEAVGWRDHFEWYCHPHSQDSKKKEGFRPTFDMYSLGIILLEIACWKPANRIFEGSNVGPLHAREALLEDPRWLQSVRFAAGRSFEDIVLVCIEGWSSLGENNVKETSPEGSRLLMVRFEKMVLRRFEDIKVS
jgi:hypothetical protein